MGSANYPGLYGNDELCQVEVFRDAGITFSTPFELETGWDQLYIKVEGQPGQYIETIEDAPGRMYVGDWFDFKSDSSVTHRGFQICFAEPEATPAPTEQFTHVEESSKCPHGNAARTFKLSYTTDENCATRCQQDEACMYFSIGWDYCIGCSDLPSTLPGAFGFGFETYMISTPIPSMPPTMEPTEPFWTVISSHTKCASGDVRDFKLDFTSLSNCASRCRDDLNCKFISVNEEWCIGCSEAPAWNGWQSDDFMSYSVDPVDDAAGCDYEDLGEQVRCLELLVEHLEEECEAR